MHLTLFIRGIPFFKLLKGMPLFFQEYKILRKQAAEGNDFPFGRMYPCLQDRNEGAGTDSGHYFHQDLLVAGKIFKKNPQRHVDIGSRLDGFVAHVATFREIEVLDIREVRSRIQNVTFRRMDLMDRDSRLINYCDSVSCLHALEHFGLGRYGDRLDINGHLIGWKNIHQLLIKGGTFYLSVPIGKQRIEFNAHRVFSLEYLVNLCQGLYTIGSFSYVDDAGDLVLNAPLTPENIASNFNCHYGCGIFELTKI